MSSLTLLVPLDGSELAEQALPYARMLAKLAPTTIHLLHVIAPSVIDRKARHEEVMLAAAGDTLESHDDEMRHMRGVLQDEADTYLEQQAETFNIPNCTVERQVVFGLAADQIAAAAERLHSDIVVMATHGAGGLMRWALGSVTTRVLRATNRAVMVIRGSDQPVQEVGIPRRIMVGLDGSPLAERALPMALSITKAAHADLLLTQVIDAADGPFAVFGGDESNNRFRELAFTYLDHIARELNRETGQHITTTVPVGHVAQSLLEEASRKQIDLIVLGRHGIGGAHSTFLGGTTEKLSQASEVPLLVAS
jgi:nucleotide-binding universal stress UspA family protein